MASFPNQIVNFQLLIVEVTQINSEIDNIPQRSKYDQKSNQNS